MTLTIYFAIIVLGILLVALAMPVIDWIAEAGEERGIVSRKYINTLDNEQDERNNK